MPYSEKSFRNIDKSNRNQIVFTIIQSIWNQMDIRLVPNQSENGKYNQIVFTIDEEPKGRSFSSKSIGK